MKNTSGSVRFLYGTIPGRFLLKCTMGLHLDRIAVRFLWSPLSRPMIRRYVKRNNLSVTEEEIRSFRSFRELFVRTRQPVDMDMTPEHLISPCDGWLSVFPIDPDSCFSIKDSHYQLKDFLQDEDLAQNYQDGTCMIFRLCASDYHHYCYIDDGVQGKNHHIPGVLHSVQPIACEKYPVYVLNKRCWCLLETENFGPVVQCEIGALVVGGIVNELEKGPFRKGMEKGRFELAGSTIILLLESGKMELHPELAEELTKNSEVRVLQGQHIGNTAKNTPLYS